MAVSKGSKDKAGVGSLGDALMSAVAKQPDAAIADEVLASAERNLQPEPQPAPVSEPVPEVVQPAVEQSTAQPQAPVYEPVARTAVNKPNHSQTSVNKAQSMEQQFDNNAFYGLDDSYSGLSRTLGLTSGAVDVNEFKKIAERILANDPTSSTSTYGKPLFVALEAAALGLPCNALAIVMHGMNGNVNVPLVYTLLMEPAEPLVKRQYNVGNYTLDLKTVTGDIYTDETAKVVLSHVEKVTNSAVQCVDTGFNVVPNFLDLKDPDNEARVRAILFFAFGALNTAYDVRYGSQKFLSLKKSGQQQLMAQANWSGKQLYTAAGLPIRSDVILSTSKRPRLNSNQPHQQSIASRPVTALSAYVDLLYAPPRVENNQNQFMSYGIPQTAKVMWFPRLVITRAMPMGKVINIGEMLLTLATATVLGSNHNWINAFMPKRGVESIHDIGGLGWEHEFTPGTRAKIDTQDNSFSLPEFLNHTVVDNLIYSMDIEECGDMSWLEGALVSIARGGDDAAAAVEYITKAADALTGGEFSKLFPAGEPIVANEVIRIHNGYYVDGDQKVDIRNIDHLAVLNMTGKNGSGLAQKWSNALVESSANPVMSQADRENILAELAPNAVITGFSSRITFNAKFLFALANAIHKAGTSVQFMDTERQVSGDPRMSVQYATLGQGNAYTTSMVQQGYGPSNSRAPRGVAVPVATNYWNNL